ncbi:sulfotransferase family protein, partial [Okeania sp. SIO2B9]
EKTFMQRCDTVVLHAPFADIYYFSKWRRSTSFGNRQDRQNYDIKSAVEEIKSKVAPLVFFKDMAFQALPYIDKEFKYFLGSIINTFIIRHPQETITSLYKLYENFTEEEFGFSSLDEMYKIVTQELGQQPIVVESNRFRQNPDKILASYCQRIGVEFDPRMLGWNDGKLKQWESRDYEFHTKWYKTLENSSGILPPTQVKINIFPEHRKMVERAERIYEKLSRSTV